jgi:hypothetical protein
MIPLNLVIPATRHLGFSVVIQSKRVLIYVLGEGCL